MQENELYECLDLHDKDSELKKQKVSCMILSDVILKGHPFYYSGRFIWFAGRAPEPNVAPPFVLAGFVLIEYDPVFTARGAARRRGRVRVRVCACVRVTIIRCEEWVYGVRTRSAIPARISAPELS
ncbi:hypothetical protein J6590_013300 [Homalodisca vitripennis]|nr:hypothetical protein J6590_013300 [Homalodisca vitripennis]